MKATIHLCLVHNTAAANVTPALDADFRPQESILLYGADNPARADALESVLEPAGVEVSRWPVDDVWDTEHIRDRVLELLVERDGQDIALNASGGTRPMSMAAYEIFNEFEKPVFYVHPETDHLTWLHRRDVPGFDLAKHIRLPAFLRAHGAVLREQDEPVGVPRNLRKLTADLVANAAIIAKPLTTLNWLAQQAERDLRSPRLSEGQVRWPELRALIERLAREQLCELRHGRLEFPNEQARFFVNGGWLEEHTYSLLFGLRADIKTLQDVGRSVEVVRKVGSKEIRNELDVAFLAGNRLHIVECKTKRFARPTDSGKAAEMPSADTLYKLDSLKGMLGGVRTRVMLVSYNPLSKWDQQRAHDLGIRICAADQLPGLKATLTHWIKP